MATDITEITDIRNDAEREDAEKRVAVIDALLIQEGYGPYRHEAVTRMAQLLREREQLLRRLSRP